MQGLVARLRDHKQKCKKLNTVENVESDQSDTDDSKTITPTTTHITGVMADNESSNNDGCVASTSGESGPSPAVTVSGMNENQSKLCKSQTSSLSEKPLVNTRRLDQFVTKTTKSEKNTFDEQVAKFIYVTNSSFRITEHPEFIKMIQLLRPGYNPPSRFDVA